MMKRTRKYFFMIILLSGMVSCVPVKPYQRVYINDAEMQLGQNKGAKFEEQVQVYREGASGGGSKKGSGGCGCN
jgi:hypothetical protein